MSNVKKRLVIKNGNNSFERYFCCFQNTEERQTASSNSPHYELKDKDQTIVATDRSSSSEIDSVSNKGMAAATICSNKLDRNISTSSTNTTDTQSGENVTLEDLEHSKPTIDIELDEQLKKIESSFKVYEEMEYCSLEKVGPSLIETLIRLREDPDAFLVSSDPSIRELAHQRSFLGSHNSLPHTLSSFGGDASRTDRLTRRQSITLSTHENPLLGMHTRRGSLTDLRATKSRSASHRLSSFGGGYRDTVVTGSKHATSLLRPSSPQSDNNHDEVENDGKRLSRTVGTQQLSLKWAGRLAEVTPTQGQLSLQANQQGDVHVLKVRPKWPAWLSDALYDVIKINKFGKRQRRIIKLTEYHMVNIKGGKTATRIIPYKCISKAVLMSPKAFSVEFIDMAGEGGTNLTNSISDDDWKYSTMHYESLLAGHIVQQLTTRAQVRQGLDKIGLGMYAGLAGAGLSPVESTDSADTQDSASRLGFSVNATAAMIEAIGEENAKDDGDILKFAVVLGRRVRQRLNSIDSDCDVDLSEMPAEMGKMNRLLSVESGSGEGKVQSAVQRVILDVSTPEGNTARHFIANFPQEPCESDLTDLRHFIEGMFEYIVENRGVDLALLLNSDESFRMSDMDPATGPKVDIAPISLDLDESTLNSISYLAYSVVEEAMFLSLQDRVMSCFAPSGSPAMNPQVAEDLLRRKMKYFSSRSQKDWGMNDDHISPSEWRTASFEMAGVERNPTPSLRMNALVRTAKAIYSEYKQVVLPSVKTRKGFLTESDLVLGGDDILPIFIFVLCQCDLEHPAVNKDILWKLCHPDQLHGESGYYLTLYESAVEYISSLEVSSEELESVTLPTREAFRPGSISGEGGIGKYVKGKMRRFSTAVSGVQNSPLPKTKSKSFYS